MALETAEAPAAVERSLCQNRQTLAEIGKYYRVRRPSHIITCARGSSGHAATYLKYLAEIELGIPCCSIGASVVSIYRARMYLRDTILIAISQSGRSPDLLSVQAEAQRVGVLVIAITNDPASPLAREADICLPLCAGPELSIAATKTFLVSSALAAAIVSSCGDEGRLVNALQRLPKDLTEANRLRWNELEQAIAAAPSLYMVGRGPALPMAQEAALKLKETSAIHAEAYSTAEIQHGPIELINPGFPVVLFAPRDEASATNALAAARLEDAGARVFRPDYHPTLDPILDPLSIIQSFYGSAERIARLRGRNPDAPNLLAKVTQTV